MENKMEFLPSGDSGLVIKVGETISVEINKQVMNLWRAIDNAKIEGIIEVIPTYTTLMIIYNPLVVLYDSLVDILSRVLDGAVDKVGYKKEVVHIPTLYGGEHGMDIGNVADHNRIGEEEVIRIHSSNEYLVYMLGFAPGFPYLGGMSKKIATPRLDEPRTKIPAGSVGIAGEQTGVYPLDSPGGWQIIGRTPLKFFDSEGEGALLKAGQYIKFDSIDAKEFERIKAAIKRGEYKVRITEEHGGEACE